MEDEPNYQPPKRSFKGLAFLAAAFGLMLLLVGADVLRSHEPLALGCAFIASAFVLIVLAVLLAKTQK